MALVSFLASFFPFLLLLGANSACNQSFPCGDFDLEFPFTNITDPGCGLIIVNGCNSRTPSVYTRYDILDKISPNKVLVRDTQLQDSLSRRDCLAFRNLSMNQIPHHPLISFKLTFSRSITLFTCITMQNEEKIQEYFRGYRNAGCPNRSGPVYYNANLTAELPQRGPIPTECLTIQLPMKLDGDSGDLFSLLTPNFTLEWSVPQDCFRVSNSSDEFACRRKGNSRTKTILFRAGMAIVALISALIILYIFIRRKNAKAKPEYEKDVELFLKNNGNLALMRYKYSSIKKMTDSFSENLGKGGYGSVYKGKLVDGHPVAVKILNESDGNGEEFLNEVASISRTSHVNIVALLGFCFEGSKRALIYDFMPNGSLEKFIGDNVESGLGWDKLFEIALGIARGLEYLHQGCNTRILHLDIKPQNILLDKDFNPRISDFGLAKLCPNRSSIVSMMVARGTIGYIAPEVFSRNFGEVSYNLMCIVLECWFWKWLEGGKTLIQKT